jgi:glycosyltransferase involved in cell wall biosynthesis
MKVLHIVNEMGPGGGPRGYCYNLRNVCKNLNEKNIAFWSEKERQSTPKPGLHNRKFHAYAKRYLLHKTGFIFQVILFINLWKKYIRTGSHKIPEADVYVIHGQFNFIKYASLIRNNKKIGLMCHSPLPLYKEIVANYESYYGTKMPILLAMLKKYEYKSYERSDFIVAPCKDSLHAYEYSFENKQICEIASIINIDNETKSDGKKSEKIVIGYAGRMNKDKGYDIFVELAKNKHNLSFKSVGGGVLETLDSDNLDYLGWESDIKRFFDKIDILCVPNRVSYFDLIILEALQYGIPVVTTGIGGGKYFQMFENSPVYTTPLDSLNESPFEKLAKISSSDVRDFYNRNFNANKLLEKWKYLSGI